MTGSLLHWIGVAISLWSVSLCHAQVPIVQTIFTADPAPLVHEGTLDPRFRTEAETMAWAQGVETQKNETGGVYVTDIDNADYIKIRQVDFGNQRVSQFLVSVACGSQGGQIDVRLGSPCGRLLGRIQVKSTGDWQTWETLSSMVRSPTGVHDLYLVFSGGNGELFNIDWWQFK